MQTETISPPKNELIKVEMGLRGSSNQHDFRLPERRTFLGILAGAAAMAVAAISAVPVMRFLSYPLYAAESKNDWVDVGSLEEFAALHEPVRKLVNVQRLDGWQQATTQQAVYITSDAAGQDGVSVLSATCPHLGCSVAWHGESSRFVCPCHGGCFSPEGERISGPPRKNMTLLPQRIENGRLLVNCEPRTPKPATQA